MDKNQTGERVIKQAGPGDIETILSILGPAFYDDPVINHAAGKPGFAEHLFRFEFENSYCALGHSYYLLDEAGKPVGATLWAAPGQDPSSLSVFDTVKAAWMILKQTGLKGMSNFLSLGQWMAERHIHEPHYYLHAIGVAPDSQGKGVGGTMIRQITAMADDEGVACYLESSKLQNVPLYERQGFVVTAIEDTPNGGPPMWLMRRPVKGEEVS